MDEDELWPLPVCSACANAFHEHCSPVPFCTCADGDCFDLLEEQRASD